MSQTISLQAKTRTEMGKRAERLREDSLVPGVIYGHGVENISVSVPLIPFGKVFSAAGASTLVDLSVDEKEPYKVLIHAVQRDPLTNLPSHVDFYKVKMTEKLTAHVPIVFVGESPAVKALGGTLVKTLDHITIECFPQDLMHEVSIDLSKLVAFEDAIHVSDIPLADTITLKSDSGEMIVTVKAPRTEAELAADEGAPAVVAVEAVEVEKKGKKEEAGDTAEKAA